MFLADWLPRKAALDAEQRAALPEVLRRWIRYALEHREVDPEWIGPVVEAVDTFVPAFEEAFDDAAAWGPAKQIAAELLPVVSISPIRKQSRTRCGDATPNAALDL